MKIQKIINGIFRQDFTNLTVLGRTLYSVFIIFLGFDNIIRSDAYASSAPGYIPAADVLVFVVGIALALSGLFILANVYLKKATNILVAVFSLFIFVVYLPAGDVLSLSQTVGIIGAALLIRETSKTTYEEEETTN